jgi:hypothetical protein
MEIDGDLEVVWIAIAGTFLDGGDLEIGIDENQAMSPRNSPSCRTSTF